MFEILFKYPRTVFAKGDFVFLARWPVWLLIVAILAAAAGLGYLLWRKRGTLSPALTGWRPAAIWALQACMAALLLAMLWHPAISVSTLKPQQNVVAVVLDDSRSMALSEDGKSRIGQARSTLDGGLASALENKFQVRLYRSGEALERIQKPEQATGAASVTRLSDALKQIASEASSLPIGAVVLLSDGAENSGGIDRAAIAEIRRYRIPVHTVGYGRLAPNRDVEITDAVAPPRTLADSRIAAQVTVRQHGFRDRQARLTISDGTKTLATHPFTLRADGEPQTETVLFNAGIAGAKALSITVDQLDGEENKNNNTITRLVNVEAFRPRILYIEGDPRWEMKFIRRATEEDRNKIYRQGLDPGDPKELEQGFPGTAEDLFRYQGLILGNVEVSYFTPAQQELIREFVDRRGGGLLFLGGRETLSDGGYAASPLAELVPLELPARKGTFHRDPARVALTNAGRDSLLCRLVEQPEKNAERWRSLPALADYQELGEAKPAALVLVEGETQTGRRFPLLAIQNYGLGRTAVFATGGSWKWKMLQEHTDTTHQVFWHQLLRYLVADSARPVSVTTPKQVLSDQSAIPLRVVARDKGFTPMSDAKVDAHILGPEGLSASMELTPSPTEPGLFEGEYTAEKPGSYLIEIAATRGTELIGNDVLTVRREDGVAENFRTEQNRELLEKLSEETGGSYFTPDNARKLADEVSYSEAGITTRQMRDLWDMPIVFLVLILLRGAEWLVRRRWGAV